MKNKWDEKLTIDLVMTFSAAVMYNLSGFKFKSFATGTRNFADLSLASDDNTFHVMVTSP